MCIIFPVWILTKLTDVPKASALLLKAHIVLIELQVPILQIFHLYGSVVVLLYLGHQLRFQVRTKLSLLFECLFEKFVVSFELCCLGTAPGHGAPALLLLKSRLIHLLLESHVCCFLACAIA